MFESGTPRSHGLESGHSSTTAGYFAASRANKGSFGGASSDLSSIRKEDLGGSMLVASSMPRDVLNAQTYLAAASNWPEQSSTTVCHGVRNLITPHWNHPHLRGVWGVLSAHFEAVRCKPSQMFALVNRMIELDPHGRAPDLRILKIASDAHLCQLPLYTRQSWLLQAAFSFTIVVFLIFGIEPTIIWNSITGLNTIFSVG